MFVTNRWKRFGGLVLVACLGWCLLSLEGRGDTVYLKNGRILIAHNVSVQGEDVVYQTGDGRKSLPLKDVERIVKASDIADKTFKRYNPPKLVSETATKPAVVPAKPAGGKAAAAAKDAKPALMIAAPTGPAAEEFTLPDESGVPVSLSSFHGRPVLLDFWATWCGPCRESMPAVQRLYEKYGARGLAVIGVNIEGRDEVVSKYIRDGKYTFKFVFDSGDFNSKVMRQYKVTGIPRTFLVDKAGKIRFSGHPGNLPEKLIETLLSE